MHSWTAEEADTARAELRKAYYAETSQGPQHSRRRTVSLLLKCRESRVCLTTESLETLAAQLKESGYRSGFKYLLEAKKMHISAGHDWCPQLQQMLRDCRRGIEQGIGAAKKAAELRLHEISHLPDERWEGDEEALKGPARAKRCWLVAVFWVLREIEVANIRIRDIDLEDKRVTISLPMSKTDQRALGFQRTLHCYCSISKFPDGDMRGRDVCAPCAVKHQLAERYLEGAAAEDHLFCDQQGNPVEKKVMVASWQRLARSGGKHRDPDTIAGHSARRSGAKTLCRCGWPLWKVQFHARWASQAVKGYTEEVFGEIARLWRISESEKLSREASQEQRGPKAGVSGRPRQLEGPTRKSENMRQSAQQRAPSCRAGQT